MKTKIYSKISISVLTFFALILFDATATFAQTPTLRANGKIASVNAASDAPPPGHKLRGSGLMSVQCHQLHSNSENKLEAELKLAAVLRG